ncbi:hypothetical protein CU097_002117 [Rhizopus azygosporus]|uniref:Uncharacterized protein n=1 Tax=Rhizopus azygosporus TaxID=86630 RepID=A0A367IPL1_RHIAZ|nr:hypothetical protein CU097_002117 [Rhizopus azygosporus]
MSYVLLIKPYRMHPDFAQYGEEFDGPFNARTQGYCEESPISANDTISRQVDLLQKANAASPLNSGIISSVARPVTMLPKDVIMSVIKEQGLCTRYLYPARTPLFDDPDNDIFFRWTGTVNDYSKAVPKGSISSERPEVIVSCVEGV